MLHILLLILKIIGIIIAVILGLIIVLGLVILFVPIRYSIDADYHKKAVAHVKVTWLLHLLRGVVSYDEQLDIYVKALWFYLYNNNYSDDEDLQTKSQKKKKSSKKEKLKESDENNHSKEQYQEEHQVSATSSDNDINNESDKDNLLEEINTTESDINSDKDISEQLQESVISDDKADEPLKENKGKKAIVAKKQKGLSSKINSIIDKIKSVFYRIKGLIINIYNTFKGVINKSQSAVDKVKQKYNELRKKVTDPENIELVKFLWKQTKAAINIVKPSKYDINIRYGFEDSEITGWLTVRLAIIYGFLGLDMNIIPDFDNSIFEGKVYMKGSFNIFSMLVIAIKLYRNKSFRKLIKR